MNKSRLIFLLVVSLALCAVMGGAVAELGNQYVSRIAELGTLEPITVVVTATPSAQPSSTTTPSPTDTQQPTPALLPTVTPGLIQPPPAAPTPVPVPTLPRVEAQVSQFSPVTGGGALTFVGEIINTGEAPLDRPEVSIFLYDAANQLVANARGFSTLDVVLPGQRAPVRVVFSPPPAPWTRFQVVYTPQAPDGPRILTYTDLEASGVSFSRDPTQGFVVTGNVRNKGSRNAVYVQALVTLYGADGHVVGLGDGFADPDHLGPNQSATFHVNVYNTAAEPVNYRVQLAAGPQ